jgi:opacity protein-like surface antigen
MDRISRIRKSVLLGGSALMLVLSASSGALAQNCVQTPAVARGGLQETATLVASTSSSILTSIGNVSTAFLTQQSSAFVANPGGAGPGQQGGGVWVRGVGGEVEIKSTSTTQVVRTPEVIPGGFDSPTINCSSRERETFAGVQVGADIARLNMNGWNVNIGTTAGFLESRSRELNGVGPLLHTNAEVSFGGVYAVATIGGFFADVVARGEFYNFDLNAGGFNLHDQPFSAHGVSISASAGYQFALANSWFIEPSAGFIWSRTKFDSFNLVGVPGVGISGTMSINDIDSEIGRATVRVGTSVTAGNLALQPFASASVFHEFAGDATSRFQTCTNCVFGAIPTPPFFGPVRYDISNSTSRIGTYGQFSLGLAGQVLDTGWLGFVRGDYRVGDNLEGWTANAGVRYNFIPTPVAAPIITKGPALPPVVTAVNWTGFYLGGFLGGDSGTSSITFVGDGNTRPRLAGLIAGGQAGYNWQLGRYVLGIEGDAGWTNKRGARTCGAETGAVNNGAGVFTPFFFTCQNELDWVATLTGRLGATWERALIYVKAGGAWTHETFTATCIAGPQNGIERTCLSPAGLFTNAFGASDDRFGLTAGFGTEFALNANWSAKAEYNYIDFGSETLGLSDGSQAKIKTRINQVKVGVNFHFSPMSP